MKVKITLKDLKESGDICLGVGYCRLQRILSAQAPIYYTRGIYGWKADFYQLPNGWLLSTGYCPYENYSKDMKEEVEALKNKLLYAEKKIRENNVGYEARDKIWEDIFK